MSRYFLLLLCCGLAASSCVKQDNEDCPVPVTAGGLRIYIDFDRDEVSSRAANASEVEELTLFIFDKDGYYIGQLEDKTPAVGADYYLSPELGPGKYTLVAWTNLHGCYDLVGEPVEGVTKMEQMSVRLQTGEGNVSEGVTHHLYFGSLAQMEVISGQDQVFNIYLTKDTYVINLSTIGFESGGNEYSFRIDDFNARYRFDNTQTRDWEVHYVDSFTKDANGQLYGSLLVMNLSEAYKDAVVTVVNETSSEVIFEDNLIELIIALRSKGVVVDFKRVHEYDIVLIFSGGILVAVNINGWELVYEDGEIHG